jgi:hypothetical protein
VHHRRPLDRPEEMIMVDLEHLRRDYRVAFLGYLATRDESALNAGYVIGRRAVEEGVSLLELSRIHHETFRRTLAETRPDELDELVAAASELFLEVLSTWQMVVDSATRRHAGDQPRPDGPRDRAL